jgi:Sep-tRNA:Cys-tRNA synthetase
MEEMGADFIIGSGHKSMAAAGPVGILGMKRKWEGVVLRKSVKHRNKDIELLGCTVRGVPVMTLMASFPSVKERIDNWDEQVSKAQWFSLQLEKLGFIQLGDKPHRHDLLHFDAPALYEISKRVRERGYFLYKELKERGIWGAQPGLARSFKLSTFAADRQQLGLVVDSFEAILNKYS